MKISHFVFVLSFALFWSCDNDDNQLPAVEIPTNYEFVRDGKSTVSFSGQTDRLNMLSEIKTLLQSADKGAAITSSQLSDMFANENSPFTNSDLNISTKQLESKTFVADVQFYKDLFVSAETASLTTSDAEEGSAGRIERGTSGKFILVNEKGWEFTQVIEKGLMGSVFYSQIYNTYMTDDRVGDDIDNVTMVDGKSYTSLEHHWDEAYGYWGVPTTFPGELADEDNRFWANYTYGREELTGALTKLKTAYLTGRAAIVAKRNDIKNEQRDIIYETHELVAAATAIHYINDVLEDISANDQGNLLHHLSEGYSFVRALQFSPKKKITQAQIDQILKTDFGQDGDFWKVTPDGLRSAKNMLATIYSLDSVKDQL